MAEPDRPAMTSMDTWAATSQVEIVAIVNRTRDSFYDKGSTFQLESAVRAIERARSEGASWIDIGGVPFGPGEPVTIDDEIARVVPLVEAARALTQLKISVDTTRARVAEAALAAGADFVNDTSGLQDPLMANVVADADKGIVIVHSTSAPRVPVGKAVYADLIGEVRAFLVDRARLARDAGIHVDKIYLDPGHDLNKNTLHSLELTRRLEEFVSLGYPLFVAVSNKDFIGETLRLPVDQRTYGTAVVLAVCVLKGARQVRVHNVAEAVQAIRMVEAILGRWVPTDLRHNMGLDA
jgi:dihydropteroate synthase